MQSMIKKLSYIRDYYKVPIIGILLLVLFLAYVVLVFIAPAEEAFSIYIINQELSPENAKALKSNAFSALEATQTIDCVAVEHSLYINKEASDVDSQMQFTTAIAGHTIDVMISDTLFLEQYAPMDALMDLSRLLPKSAPEKLQPLLLEARNKAGETHIYGIDVSGCPFFEEYGFDSPVLTVAKYSEHPEAVLEFLTVLFDL